MNGIGSVHKNGRGARGVECRYDLFRNDGAFADSGNDDTPLVFEDQPDQAHEIVADGILQTIDGISFGADSLLRNFPDLFVSFQNNQYFSLLIFRENILKKVKKFMFVWLFSKNRIFIKI